MIKSLFGVVDGICALIFLIIGFYLLSISDTTIAISKDAILFFMFINFVNSSLSSYVNLTSKDTLSNH